MKKRIIIAALLLTAAGIVCFFYFFRRDERQIRSLLAKAADTVAKPAGETGAVSAMKSSRCRKLLAEPFCFSSDDPPWESGNLTAAEAAALLFRMRQNCDQLDVELQIETVQIDGDEAVADALCRIKGSSHGKRTGEFDEVRHARIALQKSGKKWRITSVQFTVVLQK